MNCNVPGFHVLHSFPKFAQSHVHWVSGAIQPSHLVSPFFLLPSIFPTSGSFPKSWLFSSGSQSRVVWYSHLFQNFPQFIVIYTVKGFSLVNEAEVDVFLEFPSFFYDPTDVDNLVSGSSAFSKSSLYIWKFSVHWLLKPSLKAFEHYLASVWNECNCEIVWTSFGIALFWN